MQRSNTSGTAENKIGKMHDIKINIDKLEELKGSLFAKIPCRNNVEYDFSRLSELSVKLNLVNAPENNKKKTMEESLKFIEKSWINMLDSFIISLKKEAEKI